VHDDSQKTISSTPSLFVRAGSFLGIQLMLAGVRLINRLSYRRCLQIAERAGDLLYFCSRRMKARVLHNLAFALGDTLRPEERLRITRSVIRSLAKNWFELFYYGGPGKDIVDAHITIEGREHLDTALAKGRGVIAVSAHLSNYPILAQQFSRKGYPFVMVIRDPQNPVTSAVYTRGRELIELHALYTMPERRFYREALRLLNGNGILGLISDENKRSGGVFVDFFGRPASTAPGPAALALRTGAAVLPVFMVRNSDNSQRVIIGREISRDTALDPREQVLDITQRFTTCIEERVREDYSQWLWTNFRWRTQPWGQSDDAKLKKRGILRKVTKRWAKRIKG